MPAHASNQDRSIDGRVATLIRAPDGRLVTFPFVTGRPSGQGAVGPGMY